MNPIDPLESVPQENVDENNLEALNDEASHYLTDTDIDDSKYLPKADNFVSPLNSHQNTLQPNLTRQMQDMQILNDKIRHMKTFQEANDKSIRELQNENNLLKNEVIKLKEALTAKDAIINEFQFFAEKSMDKFKLFEEQNERHVKEKQELINKLAEFEAEIKSKKTLNEELESNMRNIAMLKEHITETENQLAQKETSLNKKYAEREEEIKNEYVNEINKLSKLNEDLHTENEKFKFEISNLKMNTDNLNALIEDKDFDYQTTLTKKEKEIKRLNDEIEELKSTLNENEKQMKDKITFSENEILKLNEDKNAFLEELNAKGDKIYDLETKMKELIHLQDSLTLENKEHLISLSNKDTIINQMKSQIDELHKNISSKENENELLEQDKQKAFQEYNDQLNLTLKEKSEIELENNELRGDLAQAVETIKVLHDFIRDKFNSMQQNLYKETTKKENLQKKYKGLIKQLKMKEKELNDENKSLKTLLNEKDMEKEQMEFHYQSELKNMSLYNNMNMNNNNTSIMMNQSQQQINPHFNMNNTSNAVFSNTNYAINNSVNVNNTYRFDDIKDDEQKRTLEDFKRLLNKMDEKLDLSLKQN